MFDTVLQSIFYSGILPNSLAGAVFILLILGFRCVTKQWSKGYVRALWILLLAGMLAPPLLHGSFYTIRNIGMDRISADEAAMTQSMLERHTADEGKQAFVPADEEKTKSPSTEKEPQQKRHLGESNLVSSLESADTGRSGWKMPDGIRLWGTRIWFVGAAAMILFYLCQYLMLRKK